MLGSEGVPVEIMVMHIACLNYTMDYYIAQFIYDISL